MCALVPCLTQALQEAHRVLKPGGRFLCLEFSQVNNPLISRLALLTRPYPHCLAKGFPFPKGDVSCTHEFHRSLKDTATSEWQFPGWKSLSDKQLDSGCPTFIFPSTFKSWTSLYLRIRKFYIKCGFPASLEESIHGHSGQVHASLPAAGRMES